MLDVTFGGTRDREPLAAFVEKFGSNAAPVAIGRFTMADMWRSVEQEAQTALEWELSGMLADCLNRIEQARDELNRIVQNQAFVGTFAQAVAGGVQWILDGEPDGADA